MMSVVSAIPNLLSLVINGIFDISDSIRSKNVTEINANVIELACAVTDDLPIDLTNDYCKSLEVVYASLIRAIIQSSMRNRGNSSPKDIFKSLPLLTNFDAVDINKELGAISSVASSLFGSKSQASGSAAVNAFLENVSLKTSIRNASEYGLEGDVFLKETRGGIATFVDVQVTITTPGGGRPIEKIIPIGISVKPKRVSPQEMMGFFIKQNNKLNELTSAEKIKAKKFTFKSLFNRNRIVNNKIDGGILDSSDKKVLANVLESVKNIDKPFICLLMSSYTRDMLMDAKVDITKPALLKNIYNTLPIMSVAIYDMGVDMFEYSLYRSQTALVKATAASFNTDVSQLQKTLAEGLRVQRMLS